MFKHIFSLIRDIVLLQQSAGLFFFFKQKAAYEIPLVTGVQTCALPISEAEKSKLLNELLANHYAGFRGRPNPRLSPVKVLPKVEIPGVVKGSEFVPKPPDPEF